MAHPWAGYQEAGNARVFLRKSMHLDAFRVVVSDAFCFWGTVMSLT